MANFTHESRLKNLPDIQRNYLFELYINLPVGVDAPLNTNELLLRVVNTQIPGRTITPIESFFQGTKSFSPGKTEYAGVFTVQFEEREDQKVYETLYNWQQYIFDYRSGSQGGESKRDITADIILKMYKANLEKLPKAVKFFNAWPQALSEAALDYTGQEAVRYDLSFQYDFWDLVVSN